MERPFWASHPTLAEARAAAAALRRNRGAARAIEAGVLAAHLRPGHIPAVIQQLAAEFLEREHAPRRRGRPPKGDPTLAEAERRLHIRTLAKRVRRWECALRADAQRAYRQRPGARRGEAHAVAAALGEVSAETGIGAGTLRKYRRRAGHPATW